ncbi:AAA family ATPase [Paenibacillus xylanilyticus]|uniref:AAA family ATPase n=1 Tax=Paenibacillus xylanilyticus TaxID=248903 RepID=A0A7Y6C327_9BACL|nr:AAA family ATPase [Paenibacillus xylanilyticus]NUU79727.1 AAA family ATPase [Paenibacillus xylanilyticus]
MEQINISAEKELIIERYLTLLNKLGFYNHEIGRVNSIIEARKAMSEKHRIQDAKTKLSYLMNVKLRYSDEKAVQAEQYTQLLISIKALEKEKDDVKKKLNDYTKEIFSKYEQKINRHLMNCGASFKITDYKSSFIGGKPSSNFVLTINNNVVDLGNERSPLTNPSFKNTLSEGDKSSLAIAFFLAKLESDPDIGKKVLVFDDPISSLDNHRKSYTADQIMRYSALAKQVIVLTHDTFFARALWGKFADKKTLMSQLCIKREGLNDSILDTWDIEKETRSDYYQLYHTLADFIEGKVAQTNYRSVAMCIRPILEGNLRVRFPRDFDSNDWLGGFIQKVRTSTEAHLSSIKHQLDDLEDINDYSKKYHHDQNPNADSESINELELSTYVQRTLEALRGLHSATH